MVSNVPSLVEGANVLNPAAISLSEGSKLVAATYAESAVGLTITKKWLVQIIRDKYCVYLIRTILVTDQADCASAWSYKEENSSTCKECC